MNTNVSQRQFHNIPPFFNENSSVLILGSFPSVKSRELGFYYGHPQNRFWKVLSKVYGEEIPSSVEDKKDFLLRHNIALWDVIKSCDIVGSSDSSIKNIEYNDLNRIFSVANIKAIFLTGKLSYEHYCLSAKRYGFKHTGILLSSPSSANAAKKTDDLVKEYTRVKTVTEEKND